MPAPGVFEFSLSQVLSDPLTMAGSSELEK
jgi:hypothetical protein